MKPQRPRGWRPAHPERRSLLYRFERFRLRRRLPAEAGTVVLLFAAGMIGALAMIALSA